MYVYEIIPSYTLYLYNGMCQFYLSKAGKEKKKHKKTQTQTHEVIFNAGGGNDTGNS